MKTGKKLLSVILSLMLALGAVAVCSPAAYADAPSLTEVTLQQDGRGAYYTYKSDHNTLLEITLYVDGEAHSISVTPSASVESVRTYFLMLDKNVFGLTSADYGKTLSLAIKAVNYEGEKTVRSDEMITLTKPELNMPDTVDCTLLSKAVDMYDVSVVSGISWTNGSSVTKRIVEKQNGDSWEIVDDNHVMTASDGGVYRIHIETNPDVSELYYSNTFTVHVPTVNYNLNGGVLHDSAVTNFMPDDLPVELPEPERENYTFGGWYESEDFSGDAFTSIPEGTSGDINLYAQWIANEFNVTWMSGGEEYKTEKVPFDSEIKAPEDPVKDYYTFTGWDPGIPETMPAKDLTFNALFTANEYTATFVDENGNVIGTAAYTVNTEKLDEPEVPAKEGYDGAWEEYELTPEGITVKPVYTPANICKLDHEYHGDTFWGKLVTFVHNLIWTAFSFLGIDLYVSIKVD